MSQEAGHRRPEYALDHTGFRIRLGRVCSLDIYEIKDSELDLLEKGPPATIQLNFAIFLFSTAFTTIACLATATFSSDLAKTFFAIVSVVGVLMGSYLLLCWKRTRSSICELCERIRDRIPKDESLKNGSSEPCDSLSTEQHGPATDAASNEDSGGMLRTPFLTRSK